MITKDDKVNLKNKLLEEKERINHILDNMKKNETIGTNMLAATQDSLIDEDSGDTAAELQEQTTGIALKNKNEDVLLKINNALENISKESYGLCERCGKEIDKNRLDFIPYCKNCIDCQNIIDETSNIATGDPRGDEVADMVGGIARQTEMLDDFFEYIDIANENQIPEIDKIEY